MKSRAEGRHERMWRVLQVHEEAQIHLGGNGDACVAGLLAVNCAVLLLLLRDRHQLVLTSDTAVARVGVRRGNCSDQR